jgi:hypothetical protein
LNNPNNIIGIYTLSFNKNNQYLQGQVQTGFIDFINDGKDVPISTNANSLLDSFKKSVSQ